EAMKSKKSLEKSWVYCMLRPLVGSSFFICPYGEWKLRRKLLTPSFHSDMLRDYLSVFNEQSQKLMRSFKSEIKKEFTFIEESIYMCTLNTICEYVTEICRNNCLPLQASSDVASLSSDGVITMARNILGKELTNSQIHAQTLKSLCK
ncbi:hypothetical protein TNCT_149981, partial [Trichonephila clavata]